ncbi:MAG: hydroxymethylbilane synthase [Deltaproteobacteria bacterium]|nr:hydroxymethylbilane synthase [Deltaproteobacteria bacterium]
MKKFGKRIIAGTRGSLLARAQTNAVIEELILQGGAAREEIELLEFQTAGDRFVDRDLAALDAKGFFVKELEEALLSGKIDLAVHSMKDLQTEIPEGLSIGGVLRRGPSEDLLCSREPASLETLEEGSLVGTGSLRRKAQILALRPDLVIGPIRGNVDTRLKKLERGEYRAVVLSAAGIDRLGIGGFSMVPLPIVPAVGQGAIGIEVRREREDLLELLQRVTDEPTLFAVEAERSALRRLKGGCLAPIGIHCFASGRSYRLAGIVASLDGKRVVRAQMRGEKRTEAEGKRGWWCTDPRQAGEDLAEDLLKQGAEEILDEVRGVLERMTETK